MSYSCIVALILAIAVEIGVPPNFALSIAKTENAALDPYVVSAPNRNGTVDRGIMQLNSNYFDHVDWHCPEANIRAGVELLKELIEHPLTTTYWAVAICYNAGTRWLVRGERPPESSIDYANKVLANWNLLANGHAGTLIRGKI